MRWRLEDRRLPWSTGLCQVMPPAARMTQSARTMHAIDAAAASAQALDIGKERLRDFLESSDTGRQAMAMADRQGGQRRGEDVRMDRLNGDGKRARDDDRDDI